MNGPKPEEEKQKPEVVDDDDDDGDYEPYDDYDEEWTKEDREREQKQTEVLKRESLKKFRIGLTIRDRRNPKWTGLIIPISEKDNYRVMYFFQHESVVGLARILTTTRGTVPKRPTAVMILCDDLYRYEVIESKTVPVERTNVTPASEYMKRFGEGNDA